MSNIAVRVEGLGKMYRIGGKQERYRTLRDSLTDAMSAPFKRARSLLRGQAYGAAGLEETIWALKDVSFEVKHGEVVGIIGRNGAGKSTLLKILSRITEPTEGYADVYGRVGSLLEVGTGFHPELTGRENIYLNGAILGMGRAEIDRKFDEIVAFAEVEKFIDTPVKHYSSGMGLRLGFAVAAHLEPEILVVDEVLAVGDAQFQKKCLGKMSDVASEGRTVLFVSHNMAAVRQLCSKGIYLNEGNVEHIDEVASVVDNYLHDMGQIMSTASLADRTDRLGGKSFRFLEVGLVDAKGQRTNHVKAGESIQFHIRYSRFALDHRPDRFAFSIRVDDSLGTQLFTISTVFTGEHFETLPPNGVLRCKLDEVPLVAGSYRIALWCGIDLKTVDFIENTLEFVVEDTDVYATGRFPTRERHGVFFVTDYSWSVTEDCFSRIQPVEEGEQL